MASQSDRGITVEAQVKRLLRDTEYRVTEARMRVYTGERLTKTERDTLQQSLAGAIGNLEIIRLWLVRGAPQ